MKRLIGLNVVHSINRVLPANQGETNELRFKIKSKKKAAYYKQLFLSKDQCYLVTINLATRFVPEVPFTLTMYIPLARSVVWNV